MAKVRPAEFDANLVRYLTGLRRLASRLGFHGERREELVNDTAVQALRKWESFRPDGGFYNWLCFLMRNRAREWRKKDQRTRTVSIDTVPEFRLTVAPTQEEDADRAKVGRAIAALRPTQRTAITSRMLGHTLQETADMEGNCRTRQGVAAAYLRGVGQLQHRLAA